MAVVIHAYTPKNLKKLTLNEDADCASCAFSEKCRTVDGLTGIFAEPPCMILKPFPAM